MQIERKDYWKKRKFAIVNDDGNVIARFETLLETAMCVRYLSGAAMSDADASVALLAFAGVDEVEGNAGEH